MCVRQKSLMQQGLGGDGDNCSTCTSKWSSDSSLCSVSGVSLYPSDCKGKADRSPYDPSVNKQRGPKPSGLKKGNKGPRDEQKTNHPCLKSLPARHLGHSKPSIQSEGLTYIRRLESQVWDLQQQLAEARPEDKLLKRIQHCHMVALQHSQDSMAQVLAKHKNETKSLRKLLQQTSTCRDNYARKLQAAENKLHSVKTAHQHQQRLSQDQSLLQRGELTKKLAKASAELEERDRRVQGLEKNLKLCQASFKRQLAAEQRKVKKAMETICSLHKTIDQLSREKQDVEKELKKHNGFIKGPSRKGRENKMDQKVAPSLLETFSEIEERLEQDEGSETWCFNKLLQESSPNAALEKHQEDETRTDHSAFLEENTSEGRFKKSQRHHTLDDRAKDSEAPGEKQKTNVACALETSQGDAKNKMSFKKSDTNTRSNHLLRTCTTKDLLSATQTRANVTAPGGHNGGDSGCLSTRWKHSKKI